MKLHNALAQLNPDQEVFRYIKPPEREPFERIYNSMDCFYEQDLPLYTTEDILTNDWKIRFIEKSYARMYSENGNVKCLVKNIRDISGLPNTLIAVNCRWIGEWVEIKSNE